MRRALAVAAVALLTGCGGAPQDPAAQAEELRSVAAEGALLAHEAGEGTLDQFVRTHAEALRGKLAELRPELDDAELARAADAIDEALAALPDDPGRAERRLEELAA